MSIIRFLQKINRCWYSFIWKSSQAFLLGIALCAGGIWKRDIPFADVGPFNDTMDNAREELEVAPESALPCKSRSTTVRISFKEAKDPTEIACDPPFGETQQHFQLRRKENEKKHAPLKLTNPQETPITVPQQERSWRSLLARVQLLRHYNLVQKPFPKRQAIDNSDTKAAVDKECEKLKNLQAWQETQVKSKKWSSSRHNKRVKDWLCVHFIDMSAEPRWYHALPKRHTLCRDPSMSNVIWFCAQSLLLVTRPSEAYGTQHPSASLCVQHLVLGAASYSDATDLLERFEASTVSQSLHGKTEYQVHFSTLMHSCHLKNSIECKGRVVFRGDVVKDDSGSCAVSTEQGSSASHMTAPKVLNVIARLLWRAGQASEMVSPYTPGNTEDASKLLHLSDENVPLSGFGHRDISGQKLDKTFKILLFLLTGICTDTWDSSKRFYSKMDRSGTACWCIDNKDSFFPLTWTTSRGQDPSRSHVEKTDETSWSWETNATNAREAHPKFAADARVFCQMTGRWWLLRIFLEIGLTGEN